jgi:hypothetical protein
MAWENCPFEERNFHLSTSAYSGCRHRLFYLTASVLPRKGLSIGGRD